MTAVSSIHVNDINGNAIRAYVQGTASATASVAAPQRIVVPSTTTLGSSANPSTVGKPVMITATVGAGFLEPDGSVDFLAGGVPINGCASVAVAAGTATCSVLPLFAGLYTIAADYSGDDGLSASSGMLVQRVNAPPSTPRPTPPAVEPAPAISDLQLGSRCVSRGRSGRVRLALTMQLAEPAALQIVVERAVGSRGRRRCPRSDGAPTRFRPVATLQRGAGTTGPRHLRLRLRLRPGLYRLAVRAQLEDDSLSRPVRGLVRVLK